MTSAWEALRHVEAHSKGEQSKGRKAEGECVLWWYLEAYVYHSSKYNPELLYSHTEPQVYAIGYRSEGSLRWVFYF